MLGGPRLVAVVVGSILAAGLVTPAVAAESVPAPGAPISTETPTEAPTARKPGPKVVDLGKTLCVRRVPDGLVRLPGFEFERKTSWNFLGYKYTRHPDFRVDVTYSMDVTKPSTAVVDILGEVSVSGGSGKLECELGPTTDTCSIRVTIKSGGGHTYSDTW